MMFDIAPPPAEPRPCPVCRELVVRQLCGRQYRVVTESGRVVCYWQTDESGEFSVNHVYPSRKDDR